MQYVNRLIITRYSRDPKNGQAKRSRAFETLQI